MDDDEYQKLATDTYEHVNGTAAARLLFSERLLAEEIKRRGDSAHRARLRNAYARLILVGRMGMDLYADPKEAPDAHA
jgi:hypothetical protein